MSVLQPPRHKPHLRRARRDLNLADFTLLVIGAVIGADVYVVAAIGAGLLGPAQLVAWIIAGALAALIGVSFVQCAAIQPRVGGSYAYARSAFGPLVGFLAGWALYVGVWIALPVFPVAFTNYLTYFIPNLGPIGGLLVKTALIAGVTVSNIVGARTSARINDALTIAKLLPLGVLILVGIVFSIARPAIAAEHLTPFAALGWSGVGPAVLVIFWAYAGFELAVLPAGEVQTPAHTLPRGLIVGMGTATLFYVLTAAAVVVALPWPVAAGSNRSLADALDAMLSALGVPGVFGGVLMSLGPLVSIAGVFEVFTLGLARLSYALAKDGLFPRLFARLHPRFGTPNVGLIFQADAAFLFSNIVDLTHLIDSAMLFLGVCYALTGLAAMRLVRDAPEYRLHIPALQVVLALGALSGVVLALQASTELLLAGAGVMGAAVVIYAIRRGAWRAAVVEEEHEFERFRREHHHWLLPFARRSADTPSG